MQQIESVIRIIVKSRYLPKSGTANEVGGMISASNKKNTVKLTRTDILKVTFSPESEGRKKVNKVKNALPENRIKY